LIGAPMRRPIIDRLLVFALCLPFVQCVWRRTIVTRPAVTVKVLDAAGTPVPGAQVFVYWWSYPHRQMHDKFVETSGSDGVAVFRGASKGETIAPLCMHGVPQHEHTVCVDVPGKGYGSKELERSGESITIQLVADPGSGCAPLIERTARSERAARARNAE
jgi:hypothetical protein